MPFTLNDANSILAGDFREFWFIGQEHGFQFYEGQLRVGINPHFDIRLPYFTVPGNEIEAFMIKHNIQDLGAIPKEVFQKEFSLEKWEVERNS